MKIGIVVLAGQSAGGIYHYTSSMLEALHQWKTNDEFVIFSWADNAQGMPLDKIIGPRWSRENISSSIFSRQEEIQPYLTDEGLNLNRSGVNSRAKDFFSKQGIDLLLYPVPHPLTFECGIPYVMAIHDLQHRLQPEFPEVSAGNIWRSREYAFRNASRYAQGILVDSEIGKEDVLACYGEYIQPERVYPLPFSPIYQPETNGVAESHKVAVREKYQLPTQYLFYPAQFWLHKNHARLIHAIHIMRVVHNTNTPLVLVGTNSGGPVEEAREQVFENTMLLAEHLGVQDLVHYLGYVPDEDMPALYTMATALTMSTFFGPTNIPILEAWAFDCPVLTSDIRGVREQVGEAGVLIDPRDASSIAVGIRRLWEDKTLCQSLIIKGRHKLASYSSDKFAHGLYSIIDDVRSRIASSETSQTSTPQQPDSLTYGELMKKATQAIDRQDCGAAENSLRSCIERFPSILNAYRTLSDLFVVQGNNEAAAEVIEAAEKVDPDDPGLLSRKGIIAFARGDLPSAQKALTSAIDLVPDDPMLIVTLGNVLLQQGNVEAAQREFVKATVLAPTDVAAFTNLAAVQLYLGRVDEAEKSTRRALELDARNPEALKILATLLLDSNRLNEGIQAYINILDENPEDVDALLALGLCYQEAEDYPSASALLKRVIKIDPQNTIAAEGLLQTRSALRHAEKILEKILSSDDLLAAIQMHEDELDNRVLGLIQINAATARTDGNAELAERLDDLVTYLERVISKRDDKSVDLCPSPRQAEDVASFDQKAGLGISPTVVGFLDAIDNTKVHEYFQPPAGNVEKHISVRPHNLVGSPVSSYQCLRNYQIRDFGEGLGAAEGILKHILVNKLGTSINLKPDFWSKVIALKMQCELLSADGEQYFDDLKPSKLEDISPEFASLEGPKRVEEICEYARKIANNGDLGFPLYASGAVLNLLGAKANPKAIYMMDGARRITASALNHHRNITIHLLIPENEFAELLKEKSIHTLRDQISSLKWFNSYQTIPMVGLRGERSLKRFDLIDMGLLQNQVVMDFGCNLGQACLEAVKAGALEVWGIEGMADTWKIASDIGKTLGFQNLHYLNVDFNDANFDDIIDRSYPDKVDYSLFFSVYRTKELTQRERLFQYIIDKTKKGIFFEGHAHSKIDTLEYYDWLFESFGLEYQFLGHSEGNLRPLFYIPLAKSHSPAGKKASSTFSTSQTRSDAEGYLVSAIVSTYKSERFLEGRLRDLLNQSLGEKLEIVVVDSNSPENEKAIVEGFIRDHKNIKYIRTETRETVYQAWNRGIKLASGKYITNANTDDRLLPDALEILATELEKNPEIGLVYADFFITSFENMDFTNHIRCGYSIKPAYTPSIMLSGCHMGPQPMWRKSIHEEIGYFDESFQSAGDYEFWCRLALRHPMKHIPEFLGLYLHNPSSIVNRNQSLNHRETAQIRQIYADSFPPVDREMPTGYYFRENVPKGKYVNICMVTFNRLEFTKQAIDALVINTSHPYTLTVVDNNSQDTTPDYLSDLHRRGIIKNLLLLPENVGVAKASNLAWAQEPEAEYYVKLDNDIVIQKKDWLCDLVEVADGVPQLGVVAYSFEPHFYPTESVNGYQLIIKGNVGGACFLIPKRTEKKLGYWSEEYGLYSEEDSDYGFRVQFAGMFNAYMEDQEIGIHLPSGRAANLDPKSLKALDGGEEEAYAEYRVWKDEQRRKYAGDSGLKWKNIEAYRAGLKSLYMESDFVKEWKASRPGVDTVPFSTRDTLNQSLDDFPGDPYPAQSQTTAHPAAIEPGSFGVSSGLPSTDPPITHTQPGAPRIAFYLFENEVSFPYRAGMPAAALRTLGYHVDTPQTFQMADIESYDVFVFSRQSHNTQLLERFMNCVTAGKVVIVDLDDNFHLIPLGHPGYNDVGPGNPEVLENLEKMVRHATVLTTSTPQLADFYRKWSRHTIVIPNGWSRTNPLWETPAPPRDTINLGWAGTITHREDVLEMKSALIRILREFPQTRLLIGGDPQVLSLFSSVPENQRLFHPFVPFSEYPGLLANFDILLAPLRDNEFNKGKSDLKLLEAGIRRIPWVASPTEPYRAWAVGGLIAENRKDWYTHLKRLVSDPELRQQLGEAGYQKAFSREYSTLVEHWVDLLTGLGFPPPISKPSANQAAKTLELLLEADDILVALELYENRLDPNLLALVQLNADHVRADGDPELASGLDDLASYIDSVIASKRPRPAPNGATKLFELLLDADDLPTALEKNKDHLDNDLLELVHRNTETARLDGNHELEEGLSNLAAYIEQVIASRVVQPEIAIANDVSQFQATGSETVAPTPTAAISESNDPAPKLEKSTKRGKKRKRRRKRRKKS